MKTAATLFVTTGFVSGELWLWPDQLGRRPLLFAGLMCSIISDLVFWQADGLAMVLAGRVISGLSAGIFTGTATVAVLELAPPHWRERATFFATAANMGGLGLGPMLAGALSQYLPSPLELTYLIHIALALLALICICGGFQPSCPNDCV